MSLETRFKEYAKNLGIYSVGITSADPFNTEEAIIRSRNIEGIYPSFVSSDALLRSDVKRHIPGAQSIISIAIPYDHTTKPVKNEGTGYLAKYAQTKVDYHDYLKEKLSLLADFLRKEVSPNVIHIYVDSGPLLERAIAVRAGLGWQGKNCCLLVPGIGSWVVLGEIVTDIKLKPDQPTVHHCGNCNQCIKACPTGALTPYKLDPNRCISYLTQIPGIIPIKLRSMMGQNLFGCDYCQLACPFNNKEPSPVGIPIDPNLAVGLDLISLLSLSKRQFEEKYKKTTFSWRGRNVLRRNACIALGNARNVEAIPQLIEILQNDTSTVVRGASAWALGQIPLTQAVQGLTSSLERERSTEVREEILYSLQLHKSTG